MKDQELHYLKKKTEERINSLKLKVEEVMKNIKNRENKELKIEELQILNDLKDAIDERLSLSLKTSKLNIPVFWNYGYEMHPVNFSISLKAVERFGPIVDFLYGELAYHYYFSIHQNDLNSLKFSNLELEKIESAYVGCAMLLRNFARFVFGESKDLFVLKREYGELCSGFFRDYLNFFSKDVNVWTKNYPFEVLAMLMDFDTGVIAKHFYDEGYGEEKFFEIAHLGVWDFLTYYSFFYDEFLKNNIFDRDVLGFVNFLRAQLVTKNIKNLPY